MKDRTIVIVLVLAAVVFVGLIGASSGPSNPSDSSLRSSARFIANLKDPDQTNVVNKFSENTGDYALAVKNFAFVLDKEPARKALIDQTSDQMEREASRPIINRTERVIQQAPVDNNINCITNYSFGSSYMHCY